jgi:glycosyltransferase involved in cell wall biosynthesis
MLDLPLKFLPFWDRYRDRPHTLTLDYLRRLTAKQYYGKSLMSSASFAASRSILFISSNNVWGGSEELWSRTATVLAGDSHRVFVMKPQMMRSDRTARTLEQAGCQIENLQGPRWMPRRMLSAIGLLWPVSRKLVEAHTGRILARFRPDLVVISQGLNHDGWFPAKLCRDRGIPYVMLSQKADDLYWPSDSFLDDFRKAHVQAAASCFVSSHNLTLTEEQVGERLGNAEVVCNPFNAEWDGRAGWPEEGRGLRLACLARIDAREKGQDMLIRVLSRPKWRERSITVTLFGAGHNRRGLEGMAQLLGAVNMKFAGFTETPDAIWADHHALVLPSRCEGLPLSLVEAMLHSRVVIATDVGGNAEAVVDNETGFIAASPTERDLDEALERAWAARSRWREMGLAGGCHIRTLVPKNPVRAFADRLLGLCNDKSGREPRDQSPVLGR